MCSMLAGPLGSWAFPPRAITSLIRLLPVPAPRQTSSWRGMSPCRCISSTPNPEATRPEPPEPKKKKRRRLDEVCLEQYPELSRNVIQSWIVQGKVRVDDRVVHKSGTPVPATARVLITAEMPKYVCRAGLKLEAAFDKFNIDPTGLAALDSGLSTGGFTDCLLQRGAARVVGIDVGYGQVAEKIRVDPRVTVVERTNLRHVRREDLPGGTPVDIVTLDLSFISSLKMRETVADVLRPGGQLVLLIKPQFEAGRAEVSAGGVVRDVAVREEVLARVIAGWEEAGFGCRGWIESPIKGAASGNTEYLAHFVDGTALAGSDGNESAEGEECTDSCPLEF